MMVVVPVQRVTAMPSLVLVLQTNVALLIVLTAVQKKAQLLVSRANPLALLM
jgi:hypothetical protein